MRLPIGPIHGVAFDWWRSGDETRLSCRIHGDSMRPRRTRDWSGACDEGVGRRVDVSADKVQHDVELERGIIRVGCTISIFFESNSLIL
jgi:hypothetical protein